MKSERMQRAAIYIRVSTAEQSMHGHSLLAQKEYLEKYAVDHDMIIVGIYADEGQTARKELKKRKAIHSLLKSVEREEVDVILFWKMDRWFRNVADFYKVQEILDAHQVSWIAAAEPNINMNTRDGRLSLNLILSIGQNEVDTTSERIKFTVDNMIQNGRLVWGKKNMPFGYTIGEVNGKGQMIKDEETSYMVEEFYRYFRSTHKKKQTVIHMQNTFGINFSYSMLRTMLTSEFYIGKYRNNTNYCPAYLTLDEWKEIQKISAKNVRRNYSGRIYLFASLIRCPSCGQLMVGSGTASIINRKTKEKRWYCYYRCNRAHIDNLCNQRKRISQNLMEAYLIENLENEFYKFLIRCEKIAEKRKRIVSKRTPEKIRAEQKRLNILFQKNRIDFDYYDREYNTLEKELSELEIIPEATKDYSYLRSILNSDFKNMYRELSEENRQNFWHQIIEEIHIDSDCNIKSVDFL